MNALSTTSKRNYILMGGVAAVLILVFTLVVAKYRQHLDEEAHGVDSAVNFQPYVSAYTSGTVSAQSTVQVVFTQDVAPEGRVGKDADGDLMSFSPDVDGTLTWVNARTLEFVPEGALESGRSYRVRVAIEDLFENVPEEAEVLVFTIHTLKQGLGFRNLSYYARVEKGAGGGQEVVSYARGEIRTADATTVEKVKEGLMADLDGRELSPEVESAGGDREYRFSVRLPGEGDQVNVKFRGKVLGLDDDPWDVLHMPNTKEFSLVAHTKRGGKPQCIILQFSQPLSTKKDFSGLVHGRNVADPRIEVDGNLLKVYPTEQLKGEWRFTVERSIESYRGERLKESREVSVNFSMDKPRVEFVQSGAILPTTGAVQLPIRTSLLRGVDVYVYEIFESNIPQYFQTSTYRWGEELHRVGRLVRRKTVMLSEAQQGESGVYVLDLTSIVEPQLGAIYRIGLGMRRELAVLPCDEGKDGPVTDVADLEDHTGEERDYERAGYNWSEREDPCKPSYYMEQGVVWNMLHVTNLGLIAKRTPAGEVMAFSTNLTDSKPISGVKVRLLDYQLQPIGEGETDSKGACSFAPRKDQQPFLLIASEGAQRAYLNVRGGGDLSFSTFDVGGVEVQKGLQGYFYGERDVWRPGDTLHLGFMLADRDGVLPEQHPVVFTLTNSRGQEIDRMVTPLHRSNLYTYTPAVAFEMPTGMYTVRASIGNAVFSKSLRIETVKPNRLKVGLSLPKGGLEAGTKSPVTLESAWLHGAPARRLKYEGRVRFVRRPDPFEGFEGYVFTSQESDFRSWEDEAFSGRLSVAGLADVQMKYSEPKNAPGMLTAVFTTKVFEEGGGFSISSASTAYSPFSSYVGLKAPASDSYYLETDREQEFRLVSLSRRGKRQGGRRLDVTVYKLRWEWWWEHDDGSLASYINSTSAEMVYHDGGVVTNGQGEASVGIRIDYPAWGRYLVRVRDTESGHVASQIMYWDWPASRERGASRMGSESTVLSFTADKEAYAVGEEASISVPTPAGGQLLVSVENGSSVLQTFWREAKGKTTQLKLKITEGMAPNVYVTILLLQPYGQSSNDLPLRLYGTIPLMVVDKETYLSPVIDAPGEVRPGRNVQIAVSEEQGRPMSFTLAVVDRGLLDLTGFRTPNPWDFFYSRQALGVATIDAYDQVIGAYAGSINGVLRVGGGLAAMEAGGGAPNPLATRFTPLVKFFGPYHLKSRGKQKVEFRMPEYIGAARIMVVAEEGRSYGSAEREMLVRSPLMVQTTLPRVLGINEEVKLPVTLFAMSEGVRKVMVRVETNDLLKLDDLTGGGVAHFKRVGDKTLLFGMRTTGKTGIARVHVMATSGKEKAETTVEVEVRNPYPSITRMVSASAKAGQTVKAPAFSGDELGSASYTLELSSLPSFGLKDRLDYMNSYPFTCLEQLATKATVRMLYPLLAEVSKEERDRLAGQVQEFVNTVRDYQVPSGGFAFFQNYSHPSNWLSSYMANFLVRAESLGYQVPHSVLEQLKKYQRSEANAWTVAKSHDNSALNQAYRLLSLAHLGNAQLGAMNRLREVKSLSPSARIALAGAYAVAGNGKVAKALLSNPSKASVKEEQPYDCYGSTLRDMALELESLTLVGEHGKAATLIQALSARFMQESWLSTQEIGATFLAVARFAKATNTAKNGVKGELLVNGRRERVETRGNSLSRVLSRGRRPEVSFSNTSSGSVFMTLSETGKPKSRRVEATSNNLSIQVTYADLDGTIIKPSLLGMGTEFLVQVRVHNPGMAGKLRQLALNYTLPAGWEVRPDAGDYNGKFVSSPSFFQDFRDDRVLTYFELNPGETREYYFTLSASYEGKFAQPPVVCSALYQAGVSASTAGSTVVVGH
ncbi:MAG: hypothetical protein CSA07_00155 [Bacteroidia bacterium]|nr:MAG: hypothetical protein CSA07_00155 [Bacteroidia bacterium]